MEALSPLNLTSFFISKILSLPKETSICIVGDYDVDGVCGTLIMYTALAKLGFKNLKYYIPDRLIDGYGMKMSCLENKNVSSADLLITVDNGISCKDVVNEALLRGKDVIVTDHHLPTEGSIPENILVIDPKYNNDVYSGICGATVALKLTYQLFKELNLLTHYPMDDFLLLAGVATVADMMPMLGENRYIVKETFRIIDVYKINKYFGTFVYKFMNQIGGYNFMKDPNQRATESLISFYIAPTINAVSRVTGNVNVLLDELINAILYGGKITSQVSVNFTRKKMTTELYDKFKLDETYDVQVFTYDQLDFTFNIKGVLGLIANKITDSFNRVALIGTHDMKNPITHYEFSGRSIPGYNLHEGISRIKEKYPELKISGGGHAAAMGVKLEVQKPDDLDTFKKALDDDFKQYAEVVERVHYEFSESTEAEMIQGLVKYSPFGSDLRSPLLSYSGNFTSFTDATKDAIIGSYLFKLFPTKRELKLIGKDIDVLFNITLEDVSSVTFRCKSLKEAECQF